MIISKESLQRSPQLVFNKIIDLIRNSQCQFISIEPVNIKEIKDEQKLLMGNNGSDNIERRETV